MAQDDSHAGRIGVVVVAHGELGETLVRLVEKILGEALEVQTVSVGWDDEVGASREKIEKALKKADQGRGVLILTDMFGGTPTNLTLPFLRSGHAEVVTGFNLPMLVKVPSIRQHAGPLREAANRLQQTGQRAIQLATQYLDKPTSGSSD